MPTIKLCDWCGTDVSGEDDQFYVVASKGGDGSVVCEQMTGDGVLPYPLVCRKCRMALWTHQFDELVLRHAMLSETYPIPIYAMESASGPAVQIEPAPEPPRLHRTIALLAGSFALVGLFCLALAGVL
jgi:hypothetical protein